MIFTTLSKIPKPWNWILSLVAAVLIIAVGFWLSAQIQACGYSKAHKELEAETQKWQKERAALIADAEAKEKHIEELEPQVVAFRAAAEQGKRLDEEKAKQIEEISKKETANENTANASTDCRTRATRLCDMFRATDKRFDCGTIFAQCK